MSKYEYPQVHRLTPNDASRVCYFDSWQLLRLPSMIKPTAPTSLCRQGPKTPLLIEIVRRNGFSDPKAVCN